MGKKERRILSDCLLFFESISSHLVAVDHTTHNDN